MQNLGVRVRLNFENFVHVRAMCMQQKLKCASVRPKNPSQLTLWFQCTFLC